MANSQLRHFLQIAVIGAIFGGVFTPVVVTLFFVIDGESSIRMIGSDLLLVSVIAAPIGSACGLVGGIWLGAVGRNCRSRLWLTIHGALAGFVLSLLFVLSEWFRIGKPDLEMAVFFPAFGGCVGAAGAALFGRLLMKPLSSS